MTTNESGECWGYSNYERPDNWEGMCATRDEAIWKARHEYRGETIWVVRGRRCHPSEFMPDADDILEDAGNRASDTVGEAAEDFPDLSDEATAELDALLEQWASKHLECRFWVQDGDPERIDAVSP